jgi:aldehyde:ferredoxin oxidoreductase
VNNVLGWTGVFLNIDLSKSQVVEEHYDQSLALNFLGGRGFAAKILWDRVKQGTDPLSPENILIFAAGPLTAIGLPNSGKLVVASKSPLTGGYVDGNIGTLAAVHLRKAGYDALIVKGKAEKPVIVHIMDKTCEFLDAKDFWGLSTFETDDLLRKKYGGTAGIVSIGPAGEKQVKFATVVSQEGRSGGRPAAPARRLRRRRHSPSGAHPRASGCREARRAPRGAALELRRAERRGVRAARGGAP